MQRDSTEAYITDWEVNDSSIIVQKKALTEFKNANNPGRRRKLKLNSIK